MNKFDLTYPIKVLSDIIIHVGLKLRPKMAPIHENTYSTHIPILIGLSQQIDIINVLELGSGYYSTKLFLNKDIFPNLKRLDSYEDDLAWGQKIKIENANDTRLNLHITDRPIYRNIKSININDYDLVFIDDSQKMTNRVNTILEVLRKPEDIRILVIHDFETRRYRKAARKMKHYFTFSNYTPCTGVLWQHRFKGTQLGKIFQIIEENKETIDTVNVEEWIRKFK